MGRAAAVSHHEPAGLVTETSWDETSRKHSCWEGPEKSIC